MNARLLLFAAILSAWLAMPGFIPAAQFETPAAALVVLKRAGATPNEFSSVLEFTKIDFESPHAIKLQLPNGQTRTLPKNEIGLMFWYPDPMAVLAGTSDAPPLNTKRAEAAALAARFPQAKAICARIVAGIDSDLEKLSAGQVRYRGVWQSSASAASTTPGTPGSADFASLSIAGTVYSHVTISRLENGALQLQHDGGVLRVPLNRAPPEILARLPSKAKLFEGYKPLNELAIEGATLKHAVLAGDYGDSVAICHDRGVSITPKASLPQAKIQLLASTAPKPPAGVATKELAADSAGTLVMVPGEGPREPQKGWRVNLAEQREWEAAGREEFSEPSDFMFFKNLYSGSYRGDRAIDPNLKIPRAKDSIAFINTRIAPLVLGYNKTNACMVLCAAEDDKPTVRAAFYPNKINATVYFKQDEDGPIVVLEGRDGEEAFSYYHSLDERGEKPVLWRNRVREIYIPVSDMSDAKRVARAFSYLIITLGGRSSSL